MQARNLLWLLPLLFAASSPLWEPELAAFLTPRCDFNTKLLQEQGPPPGQNFVMDEVVIAVASNGHIIWEMEAVQAWSGEDAKDVEMQGLRARYVGADKDPVLITSDRAHYNQGKRHLVLRGQVVLDNPRKAQRLLSEELHYQDNSEIMTSPGKVRIIGPGVDLEAGNMTYNLRTGTYDFAKRVQMEL